MTPRVAIRPATVDDVDVLVDAWVALAAEQRAYGSHLQAGANRTALHESLSRRAVLGEALVAHRAPEGRVTDPAADQSTGRPTRADAFERTKTDEATVVELDDALDGDMDGDGPWPSTVDDRAEDLPGWFVGFVSFGLEVDGFERDVERGTVHNLYVRPEVRSRGVGRALLQGAEGELRAAGADCVTLEALAANEAAVSFYREAGYREHRVELEKSLE